MNSNTSIINKNDPEFLFDYISHHADEKKLVNTMSALQYVRDLCVEFPDNKKSCVTSLMVCRMLIDLNIDLTAHDEDIMLAAAICHFVPAEYLGSKLKLNSEISAITMLLNSRNNVSDSELEHCFHAIQGNKLALLIAITEQGTAVERLHVMTAWQVRKFIYDTRRYYYSMCIYAKEHYHELLSPVGILLEKLRNLTDVSEVLIFKYENMEIELTQEIQTLKEENATIKGILNKLENH